jgi:hypothetical protein
MVVNEVELFGSVGHLPQFNYGVRHMILHSAIQPEPLRATRDQLGRRLGVSAGEQHDLVPTPDELLRHPRDDSLRAAITFRRHTFVERCDLGNPHGSSERRLGVLFLHKLEV